MEWPTWELQAHGSAAPAPDPAAPDDPAGSRGPGCPLPRLDPLGPWCSARLTFADGARVDVLVTVSDDHITVEDVRADPPLPLGGLADLARWIDGPLDDAFRAATGRPRKPRPAPRQPGPADLAPERGGGARTGPPPEPVCGAAPEPVRGPRPAAPHEPTGPARSARDLVPERGPEPQPASTGAGAAAERATCATGETRATGEVEKAVQAVETGAPGAGARGEAPTEAEPVGTGAAAVTGVADGEGAPPGPTVTGAGLGHPADPSADPSADVPEEPAREQNSGEACEQTPGQGADQDAEKASTCPDASDPSPSPAPATPAARARSVVLARTRTGERRKIAADAYREAQREGRDPVQAVMLATGRNRRRSLRLIAGARDDGLLTPRHNKR
ncbi:DUF6214 family protein [Streptomyces sp. NPDC048611]|uniref:DUF6214 family protein n=1 Tax=Streptomyces sp. NPDC048611 TaxID=3155635 RepID=UPI00343E7965